MTAAHRERWLEIERALEDAPAVDGGFRVELTAEQARQLGLDG